QKNVSNTATASCPLITTPQIVVTQECPTSPAGPDGILTFTGTVKNTGNVTLTGVVVNSDQTTLSSTPPTGGTGDLVAPTAGLVGYWPLNESSGTVALDESGSG